ncbi:hypothetical protein [Agriterribacter sp.]|uniref:hypothetical protein n=1 Tax=Agriterribacter sp. TaxID=2821509 RepID=UPI002B996765|nr:hypothetical protein [Agriterribacter sp.]HRO47504.1 hypothetical protein [Agriterribacter sp.]HRQ18330.1 hypothetical protein [Agriterribacter sp.]
MKKFLVIALIMLYGASSSGVTFQLHYCCGKFKNIEWTPVKDDGCGSKHSMGEKPCCEYKSVSFSEDKDYARAALAVKAFKASAATIPVSPLACSGSVVFSHRLSIAPAAQMLQHQPPLFLLHSVFRI